MKELFEIAAEKIRLEGRKRPANMERRLVSLHNAYWQRRTKEQRTAYEMQASDHADSKWRTIEEDTLALHADIAVRKARIEEEAARRKPILVSACTWTAREFEVFEALAVSAEYTPSACLDRREALVIAPEPTADSVLKLFGNHDIGLAPDAPRPAWLGDVVSRRSQFDGTALAGWRAMLREVPPRQATAAALRVCSIGARRWTRGGCALRLWFKRR